MTAGKTNVIKRRVQPLAKKEKLMTWTEFKRRVSHYQLMKSK